MNRNLTMATALALTLGAAGTANAQKVPYGPFDDVWQCVDPTVTNPKPYSDNYNSFQYFDDLIGITVGIAGTVNFSKVCWPPNGITVGAAGRIGFYVGPLGSVQDTAYGGAPIDDWMLMTYGGPVGVGGNWGYGKSVRTAADGATTRTAFGQNAIDEYFYGASDRYFVIGTTNDNIRITLRVDVLGDANRLQWTFLNQGVSASIGFDFGQWVYLENFQWAASATFVDVPGLRPLTTDRRFSRTPDDPTHQDPEFPISTMPPYVNFGITRATAYGLNLPLQPTTAIPDLTPVDILDIGKIGDGWLLGPKTGDSRPMPAFDFKSPKPLLGDTSFIESDATSYVQRWLPLPVNQGATRVITAYYRSTWGVSDYDKPYSAVVDTPKVVGVQNANPDQFTPNPMVVRVYVDNTRGFSTVDQAIQLNDVRVTLNLPQGMSDAADATHTRVRMVRTINRVNPQTMNFVDFNVYVDPTLYGVQQYNVKIEPNPGIAKTLTGTINVASQPNLEVKAGANLVTAPWTFTGGNSWQSILSNPADNHPLVPDLQYQAYEWNAAQQAYVLQTSPRRGFGTWLISTVDATYEKTDPSTNETITHTGIKQLFSSPTTPNDLVSGADLILLRPGWNLIANPYNYSIPLGQIVGVSETDPRNSQTFQQLANSNIVNSALAYWDSNTQSYKFTSGFADLLVPNRGYWLYVSSASNLTISYPPVNTAFVPVQPDDPFPFMSQWSLRLTARNARGMDDQNLIGAASDAAMARKGSLLKPPVAPVSDAISGSFIENNRGFANAFKPDAKVQEWTWSVYTKKAGTTTISWPAQLNVPKKVNLTLIDTATNRSYDMRQVQSLSYVANTQSTHVFRIVADKTTLPTGPVLGTVTATRANSASTTPFQIKYNLAYEANTTVRVLQGSKVIATLRNNAAETGGDKLALWTLVDSSNKKVGKGSYTIEVSAANTGRSTETKTVYVFVY